MTQSRRTTASEWGLVLLIVILAAFLRFHALGQTPPGLYHDEAYNGLDALQVLQGARPIFFEANNGREPIFIYLVAGAVGLLGRSPGAIRIVAALLGTLTIPVTYLLLRTLYNRNVALVGAAVLAITVWPIQLSRIGFRAVALPLFTALALWQLWKGLQSGRLRHFAVGGALYGLSMYTYLAARFTPIALVIFAAIWIVRHRAEPRLKGALTFVLVAALVVAPLGRYVITHWASFSARSSQVSVFNPAINNGDLWGTLGRDLLKVAAMFNVRGDFIPRHNIPLRPVFEPLMGIAFLIGLAVAVKRRSDADVLAIVWTSVMLLPTILAEDAPHFLRAVGILPVAFVFPALGLNGLGQLVASRFRREMVAVPAVVVLVVSMGFTWRDYFGSYANNANAAFAFETGAADLAAQTNAYLETGWDGTGLTADSGAAAPDRVVYLAPRLWRDWPSLRYLLADTDQVKVLDAAGPAEASHVRLVVWPYDPYQQQLSLLPDESAIRVSAGPSERGDLDSEPRLLAVTFEALPASELETPTISVDATIGDCAQLVGAKVRPDGNRLYLTLYWRALQPAETNYMVFVHVQQAEAPISTGDGPVANGYYSTDLWRPGDLVADQRIVELSQLFDPSTDKIEVGMYQLESLRRLPVFDPLGAPMGDSIALLTSH